MTANLDPATAYLYDPRRVPPPDAGKAAENEAALRLAQERVAAYHLGVAARAAAVGEVVHETSPVIRAVGALNIEAPALSNGR